MEEFELDHEELKVPRPLTADRKAEIDELYAQMAANLAEINGY